MKTKYIVIASLVVICGLIAFRLTMNKKKIDEAKNKSTALNIEIPVQTAAVKDSSLTIEIVKNGSIIPFKEAKALSMTSGTLKNVRFQLGDHVSRGQVLAIVDDGTQHLNLQQAKNDAEKLRSDLKTYTELLAGKATTQEKVNEIRANYNTAITKVNVLKQGLNDGVIKAPASGIISKKPMEAGMFISGGTSVATIVDLGKTKAEVFLSESEVYKIKKGQLTEITSDVYPNAVFHGKVDFISPQADETKSYETEILIDNQTYTLLRSGTFVNIKFVGQTSQQALLIPREAITGSIKDPSVYVVEKGIAQIRKIEVGQVINGLIQVLKGLQAGDKVVVSGQINLKSGTKVKMSNSVK